MEQRNPETDLVSSEQVYTGVVVKLKIDKIRLPSGRTAVREVVMHPGGVVAIPVLDDGRLLLIRQFRYPIQKHILEFPAGKLDTGLPPEQTMQHELEEEAGFHSNALSHEFSFHTSPGICNEIIHLFLARALTPVPQSLEEGEHITVEAYTVDECLKQIRSGEIADAKTILGILWYSANIALK